MVYRLIKDSILYNADCLEILPKIGDVQAVITDPPYLLESGGSETREMGGKFSNKIYNNNGEFVDTQIEWADFMPPLSRVLKEGHAYFMANNRHVATAINEGLEAGFRFHNLLVWDKGTATPNRWYMKNCEFTILLFKGRAKMISDCGSRQLVSVPNILRSDHPTEKPVELIEHYIRNSTSPGDTVLDPFMGSGTTAIACENLGRKFIGIESNPEYFKMTCQRIERHQPQESMF